MNTIRSFIRPLMLALLALLVVVMPSVSAAQDATPEPVVYGVFFYSPTCPHCINVLTNYWPSIQEEFGDQLRVMFVDATTEQGGMMMLATVTALNIESRGVPMLIIGSDVMVGEIEIPQRAPTVIREGLQSGGIGLPAVPGLEAVYQAALAAREAQDATPENADAQPTPEDAAEVQMTAPTEAEQTLGERLAADPVANGLAVVILVMLAVSFLAVLPVAVRAAPQAAEPTRRAPVGLQQVALILVSLLGLGLAVSLLAGAQDHPSVLLLAGGELVIFLIIVGAIARAWGGKALPGWLVPLAALAGLGAAGYLSYVELTLSEAVCGVVGNCNTVQQSLYARVFNIPIGVLGIAGYILILAVWLLSRERKWQAQMDKLLQAMALFGVAFSIYLTFLEPFVIGATCVWCLTSAVIMLLLLWLVTPSPAATERPLGKTARDAA